MLLVHIARALSSVRGVGIHRFHLHRNLFVLLDIKLLWFGSHTPLVTDPAVPAPIRARHDVIARVELRLVMP